MPKHRLLFGILGTRLYWQSDRAFSTASRPAVQWVAAHMGGCAFARLGSCGTGVETVGIRCNPAHRLVLRSICYRTSARDAAVIGTTCLSAPASLPLAAFRIGLDGEAPFFDTSIRCAPPRAPVTQHDAGGVR